MAAGDILFFEGFEGDQQSYVFEANNLVRDTIYARTGSYGLGWQGVGDKKAQSPIVAQQTELCVGVAFKWTNEANGAFYFIQFKSPGDLIGVHVGITSQRLIVVATPNDAGAVTVRGLSTFALDRDAWYFIEVYASASSSGGTVTVQINGPGGEQGTTGAEVVSVTGIRTLHPERWFGTYNQVWFGTMDGVPSESHWMAIDDLYMRAGDHFIGDSATVLQALEDDRSVDFTRSSGTKNFDMVDEVNPDEDGTYNHTDADGEDIFEVADADFFGEILAVQLVARARKTETQVWTLETLVQLGGDTDYSPVRFIPFPNYETLPPAVFQTAPGALPWTIARLNAMGVGYRATAIPGA